MRAWQYSVHRMGLIFPPLAIATFNVKNVTNPLAVNFRGSASIADPLGGRLVHYWDFGDGHSSSGPRVTHIYREPGTYMAELTVVDQHGQENTHSIRITVSPGDDIRISPDVN